ncbi:hypothetical protein [Phaeobacter sp. J2-8]|uniref:hypothetical protein n=1 Tax=Phaeobacter sp. J2-8 TaxID=2931394 RepID=UPI001FD59214|nr:hypothetical protein [Phaeobacter sp. J2-8]MCJ7874229.1 hypothetical protein [Phaeobacter sp. J2-8]
MLKSDIVHGSWAAVFSDPLIVSLTIVAIVSLAALTAVIALVLILSRGRLTAKYNATAGTAELDLKPHDSANLGPD